jgi:hypothetical protein
MRQFDNTKKHEFASHTFCSRPSKERYCCYLKHKQKVKKGAKMADEYEPKKSKKTIDQISKETTLWGLIHQVYYHFEMKPHRVEKKQPLKWVFTYYKVTRW